MWKINIRKELHSAIRLAKVFCKCLYDRCTGRRFTYDWQDTQGFDVNNQPGFSSVCRRFDPTIKPLISIITSYYNADAFIMQTYQCIANQTFPYFEWIIVDDGSTSQSALAVLDRISRMDARIKIFHIQRQGPAIARNEAIAHSAAELLFPLDADDLIEPSYLEILYWALDAQPKAGWAYADSCSFGELNFLWSNPFSWKTMKYQNLLSNAALIRKQAFARIGFYAARQTHYNEDWHAWLQMMAQGIFPVHIQGEVLFWYRRKEQGEMKLVDQQARRSNRRLIAQAARAVRHPVYAVEYPFGSTKPVTDFTLSSCRSVLKSEGVLPGILWLVDRMDDALEETLRCALAEKPGALGVIVLHGKPRDWRQALRRQIPDYFVLDRFLPESRWTAFISYYKMTRSVSCVIIDDRLTVLIPWVQFLFPKHMIVSAKTWKCTTADLQEEQADV